MSQNCKTEKKTGVKLVLPLFKVHGKTLRSVHLPCLFVNPSKITKAVEVFLFRYCQGKLANSSNLLCYLSGRRPGKGHPLTSNLFLSAFCSPPVHFCLALYLFSLSKNHPPSRVSEMQCQAHTVCAI